MSTDQEPECGINISIKTQYLQERSDPLNNTHAFTYTITIQNARQDSVRLLSRHWIITDQNNRVEEVKGKGVIGQQPLIKPGESFEYTSGTVLASEIGDMKGSYMMESDTGETFEAPIPLFFLANPSLIH
jgi:ApaG protein